VPVALLIAAAHAVLAVLGFDVMRYVVRVLLPLSLALTAILLVLYVSSDDPRYSVHRVFRSPEQDLSWTGFATYVTVMCGASLTLVTNVADVCRYTRSRRDMRVALFGSAVTSAVVTTFVGGYAAAATGESNPFVAVATLTDADVLLVLVLIAVVVQSLSANVVNVYTAGMSLVNAAPRLGRLRSSFLVAVAAIVLSGFPDFIDHAQRWIVHLGNVASPLTGVLLADVLLVKRGAIDVGALFEPHGRYRFVRGVNAAAFVAVGAAVAVYYALPHSWVKVAWGVGIGALAYVVLEALQSAVVTRARSGGAVRWAD
jgi:purine-cytosine permease-like protein